MSPRTTMPIRQRLALRTEPHFVYRAFAADGCLLYVGCTRIPAARMRNHRRTSDWVQHSARVTWTEYPTFAAARRAEREAIESEGPIYNVAHSIVAAS